MAQLLANLGGSFATDERIFTASQSAAPAESGLYHRDYRADWDLGR